MGAILALAALAGLVFLLSRKPTPKPMIPEPMPPTPGPVIGGLYNKFCDDMSFTEVAKCYTEGGYRKAWGWKESTGQTGAYPYIPPYPWEYDLDYPDESGPIGSHGGCPGCIMTLIHLRKPI